MATAGDKLQEQFDQAIDDDNVKMLGRIDELSDKKPKLVAEIVDNLFEKFQTKIIDKDEETLKQVAELAKTNPKIMDEIAKKFFTGSGDDAVFMKNAKELFEVLGIKPQIKKDDKTKEKTEKDQSEKLDKAIFDIDKRALELASELGYKTFKEFKGTPVYKELFKKAEPFIAKDMKISDYWDLIENSVLSEVKAKLAKEEGKKEIRNSQLASELNGGGGNDHKGEKGAQIGEVGKKFFKSLGLNQKQQDAAAARVAARSKK